MPPNEPREKIQPPWVAKSLPPPFIFEVFSPGEGEMGRREFAWPGERFSFNLAP